MDFFAHQAAARRMSRWLVVLFVLALAMVVLAINAAVFVVVAVDQAAHEPHQGWPSASPVVVVLTTILVVATVAFASLYKINVLRRGGGELARSLGATPVVAGTTEPLRRRLLNVVEEMAIASGVPVPEVYVLEREIGINAFAAGHTPADAAIVVTRGSLEFLNRAELAGVIGHEFSHVLNGDMRLNIQLLGLIHGLVFLSLVARAILRASGKGRGRKEGMLVLIALTVLAIASVGVFFERLLQAAVARWRESLADASALQFTRDTSGLRGALVKIGALQAGSTVTETETEEIAHMLFAPAAHRLFATHPPLVERIRRIDPSFDPEEFAQVRDRLADQVAGLMEDVARETGPEGLAVVQGMLNGIAVTTPELVVRMVGNPRDEQVQLAQSIHASLPVPIVAAADRLADASALFLALVLDREPAVREQQMTYLSQQLGETNGILARRWFAEVDRLNVLQRQPALLRLLPTLRQMSAEEDRRILACLDGLLQSEASASIGAFALRKLGQVQLRDGSRPPRPGNTPLRACMRELATLFVVLAEHGNDDPQAACIAYAAGMEMLFPAGYPECVFLDDWPPRLDTALDRLDGLAPAGKARLLEGLVETIARDGHFAVPEAELLRAVCACLHCPLPPFVVSPAAPRSEPEWLA